MTKRRTGRPPRISYAAGSDATLSLNVPSPVKVQLVAAAALTGRTIGAEAALALEKHAVTVLREATAA